MHCHLHRGDWSFHLTNEKKKNVTVNISFMVSFTIIFNVVVLLLLGCVLPLQEVTFRQSPPIFSILCYPCPYRSLLPHNVISPTTFCFSNWPATLRLLSPSPLLLTTQTRVHLDLLHAHLMTLTGTPDWRSPLTRPDAGIMWPVSSVELSVKSAAHSTNTSRYCSVLGLSSCEVAASDSEKEVYIDASD